MEVQRLWSQAETLEIRDGVLYRKFITSDGTVASFQVILPSSLVKELLQQLHGGLEFRHFGIRKTMLAVSVTLTGLGGRERLSAM